MRRSPIPFVALALMLAVLMPLEQSHCAWMGLQKRASSPMPSTHACCAKSTPRPQDTSCPNGCACIELPSALPLAATTVRPAAAPIAVVHPHAIQVAALDPSRLAPAPSLDVGSPPLPIDLGAHGLRAPPFSA